MAMNSSQKNKGLQLMVTSKNAGAPVKNKHTSQQDVFQPSIMGIGAQQVQISKRGTNKLNASIDGGANKFSMITGQTYNNQAASPRNGAAGFHQQSE